MKYLVSILFLLCSISSFSQTVYPSPPTQQGSPTTLINVRGGSKIDSMLLPPYFSDTAKANRSKTSLYGGSEITVGDAKYYRSQDETRWIPFGTSSCPGTQIISGSASWSGSGLVYDVTDIAYYIICGYHFASATTVTLTAANPSLPRFDVIYGDNTNNIGVLTGTPSANPQVPSVSPLTQISLTIVYIPAGSTVPGGEVMTTIYDEVVGSWSGTSDVTGINFAYPTNPYSGVVSTYVPNADDGENVTWTNGSDLDINDYQYLKFYVRLNAVLPSDPEAFLRLSFYNGATQISQEFLVPNGAYGFDANTINAYQLIVIPLTSIIISDNDFDKLYIEIAGAPSSFQLDKVYLLSGSVTPPVISFPWVRVGNDLSTTSSKSLGSTSEDDWYLISGGDTVLTMPTDFQQSDDTTFGVLKIDRSNKNRLYWDYTPKIFAGQNLYISGETMNTKDTFLINVENAITRGTMTFFGNSITVGYLLPDENLRWTTLVANYLGYSESNQGLSGSTLEKRVTVDPFGAANMVDRIPLIPPFATGGKLVFMYGLNDVRYNGANYTAANFTTDYTTVLNAAVSAGWSGSNIILCGTSYLPPTAYISIDGNPAATQARQLQFNTAVQSLATSFGATYYDAYSFMASNGARALMQSDSVHPNTQGHKIIAAGFLNAFNNPVRSNNQNLGVHGLAEFDSIKFNTMTSINNAKYWVMGTDSAGNMGRLLNPFVTLNEYGNLTVGDNAADTFNLSIEGTTKLNNTLYVNSEDQIKYRKWLQIYSDPSGGGALIDAYTPSSGAGTVLKLQAESRGNIQLSFVGTGSTNPGANIIDSNYVNLGQVVVKGFAPARKEGLNLLYISGTGSFINANTGASTFDNLFLQGFGGNIKVGNTSSATARLHLAAGTATANTSPLKFTSGSLLTTPEIGAVQMQNGLWFLDSSNSIRDTIATRRWARNNIASQWTTTGSDIYYTPGSVGIGTATPTEKLHVDGNGLFTGTLTATKVIATNVINEWQSVTNADVTVVPGIAYRVTINDLSNYTLTFSSLAEGSIAIVKVLALNGATLNISGTVLDENDNPITTLLPFTTYTFSRDEDNDWQLVSIVEDISSSGTFTATATGTANLASVSMAGDIQYSRVGNTVTVSGSFVADPTLAATATAFRITLPIASDFANVYEVGGTAFCGAVAGMGAEVRADIANDALEFRWISSDINSNTWYFSCVYQIL